MGKSRDNWTGGPLNVGAFRNYPYYRAPRVWKDAAKLAAIAFLMGSVTMCGMMQRHPELRTAPDGKPSPGPTVTVTKTIEFIPEGG